MRGRSDDTVATAPGPGRAALREQARDSTGWRPGPTSRGAEEHLRPQRRHPARKTSTSGASGRTVDAAAGAEQAARGRSSRRRVGLELRTQPPRDGDDLAAVPADLDQTFSAGRRAARGCNGARAWPGSGSRSPLRAGLDPEASPRRCSCPPRPRGESSTASWPRGSCRRHRRSGRPRPGSRQARRDLAARAGRTSAVAPVASEIDGVVSRRDNVNPGNSGPGGPERDGGPIAHGDLDRCQFQGDPARETCASAIGCSEVDMLRQPAGIRGRITGFTMGTGRTLSPCYLRKSPPGTS